MPDKYICVSANSIIAEHSAENKELSEMLGEFSENCEAVKIRQKNGKEYFTAGSYCGFARFTDGTLVEILPNISEDARTELCAEFCKRCGYSFFPTDLSPDMNFMEFFISVFAGETMKIIKSGVLSDYTSREENMNSVQGTILFAENIRRNLVHRERLYVRHDVFTPDRAENRIIKDAASILIKITENPKSAHLLKQTLSYFDEVRMPQDIAAEFGKCVNTRNAKKYSTVLNICRMIFDRNECTAFSGKNVTLAQFYKMNQQTPKAKKRVVAVRRR